jgi:mycothiol system anti-sigma-R factor
LSEISGIRCEEVLHEIEHYLHGELARERAVHFAEHLAACAPCFDRAEFQRKLKEIVRAKCSAHATTEHLVMRIQHAIRSERHPPAL